MSTVNLIDRFEIKALPGQKFAQLDLPGLGLYLVYPASINQTVDAFASIAQGMRSIF